MEIEVEVKTFKLTKVCPKCEDGNMYPNGGIRRSNPTGYHHKCSKCGFLETYELTYPNINYKEI